MGQLEDNAGMEYRWLTDEEIDAFVNPSLRARGMVELNINSAQPTCRVAGAFCDGVLLRAFCLQLFPILGPLVETDSTFRDNGDSTRGVVEFVEEFLKTVDARGWLAICDSPVSERLAKRHGMKKLESPVYVGTGG
jgi:hypothetical protein